MRLLVNTCIRGCRMDPILRASLGRLGFSYGCG